MIEDYQHIVGSVVNGQKKQALQQFNELKYKREFIGIVEGVKYEC